MEVMKYVERIEEVRARPCGGDTLSKALLRVKSGLIPKPIKNGRINFWPSAELDLVDQAIMTGCEEKILREIVGLIEKERTSLQTQSHPRITELRAMVAAAKQRATEYAA